MAKKIKCFWMRIATMFLTLYFMPFSNFIRSALGLKNSGIAMASTVKCIGMVSKYCRNGGDQVDYLEGDRITCMCDNNSSIYYDIECEVDRIWNQIKSDWDLYPAWVTKKGTCTVQCTKGQTRTCTSGGAVGTQKCNEKYGEWELGCSISGCSNGYIMVGNTCYASCNIDNGNGYKRNIYDESSSSSTEA